MPRPASVRAPPPCRTTPAHRPAGRRAAGPGRAGTTRHRAPAGARRHRRRPPAPRHGGPAPTARPPCAARHRGRSDRSPALPRSTAARPRACRARCRVAARLASVETRPGTSASDSSKLASASSKRPASKRSLPSKKRARACSKIALMRAFWRARACRGFARRRPAHRRAPRGCGVPGTVVAYERRARRQPRRSPTTPHRKPP